MLFATKLYHQSILFKMLKPEGIRYLLSVEFYEVILSQNVYLNLLTKQEKVDLIKLSMKVYDRKLTDYDNYVSQQDLDTTASILARLMYNDQFEPFMDLFNSSFIYKNLVFAYTQITYDATQNVRNLANSYLLTIQ